MTVMVAPMPSKSSVFLVTIRSRGQRAKRVSSLPKFLEIAPDWGPSITRLLSKKN